MAAAPAFKVYSSTNEYLGSVKHLEDAAALVSMRGDGATIRLGHNSVIWIEGQEGWDAGESYDRTAAVCMDRVNHLKYLDRVGGTAILKAKMAREACPSL